MSGPCSPAFDRLAHQLGGFGCRTAEPFVQLRAPWDLSNWTLPVIEAVMVGGAILALVHAVRRLRRHRDPTVLALWLASLVYLVVIEPPIYFPAQFGVQHAVPVVFVHNVFTVQFLYDRLPLYIVALYPALITLAYKIVRSLGVFRRHGLLVGAACVGLVHHCFYELFDQLGPQLRWWVWNPAAAVNHASLAAVPLGSLVIFSAVNPFALALLIRWLIGRRVDTGEVLAGRALAFRTVVAGGLVPAASAIALLPSKLLNYAGWPMAMELAAIVIVGAIGLARRSGAGPDHCLPSPAARYPLVHGTLYVAAMILLWVAALPAYFSAVHGVTGDHTPIGSLPYAAACFVVCLLSLWAASTPSGKRRVLVVAGGTAQERPAEPAAP